MNISKTQLMNMTVSQRFQYLTRGSDPRVLARFREYHKENPEVFDTFEELAYRAWDAGVRKMSHWMLLNRVRWEFEVEAHDSSSPFRISNDYFAFYVRRLIAKDPQFIEMFTLKPFKGAERGER